MADGPLSSLKIVEFAGIGPSPFCGMLLADLGAEIIRIDRKSGAAVHFRETRFDITGRGKRSIALDLKNFNAIETCLKLIEKADAVIEGFRPGVMERLGLGPDVVLDRNPKVVYGRITGWGQYGPLAQLGGHDMNYISISGALAAIGPKERPVAPINLVGDYGGGALYLAMGLLSGITHARATGQGQVIDCAMSDGAASLMAVCYAMYGDGAWKLERESNLLDGGRPNNAIFECADGKWVSAAASEQQFYVHFRRVMGFDGDPDFDHQRDRRNWPALREKVAARVKTRTQAEWCALFEGVDACFTPVLDMSEAPNHPHNVARRTFVTLDGVIQPAPSPRFSLTPAEVQRPPPETGQHTAAALADWGITPDEIDKLREAGAI
jgi:alpha-methylacyl-CoA racemase